MPSTVFTNGVTLTDAAWFNDVDSVTYDLFGNGTSYTGALTLGSSGNIAVNTNKFTVAASSGNTVIAGTLNVTGATTLTAAPTLSALTASQAVFTDGSKGLVSNAITGSGNVVMSASPTLSGTVGGALTFSGALTLSSALTYGGVTLSNAVTGTGSMVLSASPTLTGTLTAAAANFSGAVATGALSVTGNLSATGAVTFTGTNQATTLGTAGTSTEASALYLEGGTGTGGGGAVQFLKNGALTGAVAMASRLLGGTTSNMTYYAAAGLGHNWYANGNVTVASPNMSLTSTGLAVTGTLGVSGAVDITGNSSALSVTASGALVNLTNLKDSSDTSGATFVQFLKASGGNIGNITRNAATDAVLYNTSSDYRTKDIYGPFAQASEMLRGMKVYLGRRKGADFDEPLVLAHEQQKFIPWAVTGEKDAVDEHGNPKIQQLATASAENILIAGWQDHESKLNAILEELTAIKEKLWN